MVVTGRKLPRALVLVNDLIRLPSFEITPPDLEDMDSAFGAFVVYGKGSGHTASLHFGDAFSYALALASRRRTRGRLCRS